MLHATPPVSGLWTFPPESGLERKRQMFGKPLSSRVLGLRGWCVILDWLFTADAEENRIGKW